MKVIIVRCSDGFNANLAYRTLKKIGVTGSMRIPQVLDLMSEYCHPWKKPRGALSARPILDQKKVNELQTAFGLELARNGIYSGGHPDDVMAFFRALESLLPGKVQTTFTLGLNQVTVK